MTPTLEFLDRNPEMLAEMVADFQQRQNIIKAAKSKEPIDANVIDNPNLRAQIPYPKMLYNHGAGTNITVETFEEHQAALQAGWKEQPLTGIADASTSSIPNVGEVESDERMDSLERRMLALEQGMAEVLEAIRERRKPGRPPNPRPE